MLHIVSECIGTGGICRALATNCFGDLYSGAAPERSGTITLDHVAISVDVPLN
jgi:hypothetical protein